MLTAFHPCATIFLSGIPLTRSLAPVLGLVPRAALAVGRSPWWPCVTHESQETGSSRDVGVGSLSLEWSEGAGRSAR